MARRVLRAVRERFGPGWLHFSKGTGRQTFNFQDQTWTARVDSTGSPTAIQTEEAQRLIQPLARRLGGYVVGVAVLTEDGGISQRTHLLTLGPQRSDRSPNRMADLRRSRRPDLFPRRRH
jgi:hypothetical protein